MKKKIFKLTTIVCLSLFFLGLTITAHASTVSEALVTDGRALLFNNGNPTYSGLLAANEKFEAAVAADSSDQEANFFYAVTRVLVFALQQGGGTDLETLADLFEAFGMTRNENDSLDLGSPYNDPPETYGYFDPPETTPDGEDVRAFLAGPAGPFMDLVNAAIGNLNMITNTFNITLSADETGDEDIEVDYGDVLIFKSALYTLKSAILIMTAYDLNIDLRELAVFGNAGVLQIQRDLLDKYQSLLTLRGTDGAASLTSAKAALLNGIDAYSDAFNFITDETDDQFNDLFYFETSEDQKGGEFILTQLTELKSSLNENQAAQFTTINETWILTDENNKRLQIEIEKDVNGNFVSGHAWGLDGCDFLFCSGWVEEFTISGTAVTIEMGSNWWCGPIYYALTGTPKYDGDQVTGIENGNYSWTNCEGTPKSGIFTGVLENSETETETIDFNLIFGNSGKSPLDIRTILPQFDQYGEPIAGTFPDPVLNGIVPGLTNQDLTLEMDLQPAPVNTSSITGTITCPAYDGTGNIFIWAYDGPDWRSARRLGSAVVDASGTYTITGLPIGANVNIFARWDADNNGIKTFGDYVGKTGPITVASGETTVPDFSLNTMVDDSFIMTKPGVYRVFGSNTYNVPQYYYGPWDPNEIAWDRSEWTFIGESNTTETFSTDQYYKTILMVWHENSSFNFDAIEDQIAGTAFTIDESGNSIGYNWVTSGLKNSDTDQWSEPYYFKGHPDGLYANTTEWYGFNLFPMPDDSINNSTSRQLKITLVLTSGDVNGDKNVNLADAILALQAAVGLNPAGINPGADVNEDGKIGLSEVIYILQYVAGLR